MTDDAIIKELRQIEYGLQSIQVTAGTMARRAAALRQQLEPREPKAA